MNGKILLSFCIGLAVGIAGGILGTRSHYKSKYKKEMDEILDEADRYRTGADEYARTSNEEPDQNKDLERQKEYMKEEKPEQVQYHKMYKPSTENSESPEEAEIRQANEYHQANSDRPPIIITAEEAGDLPCNYNEEPLYYFMGCGTLVDDFDNVIDEPGYLLGDCLTKDGFIDEEDNRDMLFVQNFAHDVCYTVQKVEGCFQDES